MPIIAKEVSITQHNTNSDQPLRPTVIKWKDQPMIRSHSIMATVREIVQAATAQDVVDLNMIGDPSSGKTTQAITIGHLIHKMSKIPFSIRLFDKKALLDFENTLKTLSPANYVLIFDDISFLGANATKRQIEMVKQAKTQIRHLEGGQDVKIINIKNFHYTLGLDKYLRQSDFSYFTSVGSSEDDNMEKIVGSKYMGKVRNFKQIKTRIKIAPQEKKKFTYRLGTKGSLTYGYRKPFIPMLYWNNDTLRDIVSPTREWIDPVCSICSQYGNKEKFENSIDVKKWMELSENQFNPSKFKAAVRSILNENGIEVNLPGVVSAKRFIKTAMSKENIKLDDMATYYGLTPTRTKMKKDLDKVLAESKLEKPAQPTIIEATPNE